MILIHSYLGGIKSLSSRNLPLMITCIDSIGIFKVFAEAILISRIVTESRGFSTLIMPSKRGPKLLIQKLDASAGFCCTTAAWVFPTLADTGCAIILLLI